MLAGAESTFQASPQDAELLMLLEEMDAREALNNPLFWLMNCTKTIDEQEKTPGVSPYKPFPSRPYFAPMIDLLLSEPIVFIEKSRTMMASWLVSAVYAHMMFTRPATMVVFQSQDLDRALNDVKYVKTLYDQSTAPLKSRWPTRRGIPAFEQAFDRFELENGSRCVALSGDPNKSRSLHPTVFVMDEAAFMVDGEEIFNTMLAARPLHLVALSSAYPGWFRTATEEALPQDWPERKKAA